MDVKISCEAAEIGVILINGILRGEGTIAYSDLCRKMKNKVHKHVGIGRHIGDLSHLCKEKGLPYITAMVVQKNDTKVTRDNKIGGMPGKGFFYEFFPEKKEEQYVKIWCDQLNKIYDTSRIAEWNNLLEELRTYN